MSLQEAADRWVNGNTIFTETVFASKYVQWCSSISIMLRPTTSLSARARSDLARELGWEPKFNASPLQSAIEADMKAILG